MTTFAPVEDCWFLTGPTASGKSAVGVELATRISAEILSLDSMAVYRHLDIGTAKPTPQQRDAVKHHLIDLVEPSENFSLAEYLQVAHSTAAKLRQQGRRVLFVGGTPLYLKALLRGLYNGPPPDWELRGQLQRQAQERGDNYLHCRLAEVDPQSAGRLHPNDSRRLIRALEVYFLTGEPLSRHQKQFEKPRSGHPPRVFQLDWPREALFSRINSRVLEMFSQGWVEEVQSLLAAGHHLGRTARQAVGYQEILQLLQQRGPATQETIERVQTRTRGLARRQLTWFNSLEECQPIALGQSQVELTSQEAEDMTKTIASSLAETILMADPL